MAGDPLAKLLASDGESAAAPEDDAATDFLAAVKASDAKALHLAFKRMYEACAGDTEYEDDDEEEDEEV